MKKEDVICICVCMYTNTVEYSAIKKNKILPLHNMIGLGGHYAKWNIRQRKTNTLWCYLYVESKEYNRLVNKTKKKPDSQIEQISSNQWREGIGGNKGARD